MTHQGGADKLIRVLEDAGFHSPTEIGRGGMGVVYRVHSAQGPTQTCAIKVASAAVARDEEASMRFLREAAAISILDHPNVVQVYDVIQREGLLALVMEYVAGGSLEDLCSLRSGVREASLLDPIHVAELGRQAALGLGAAHEVGLVHRDVKPSNLLLTPDASIKVGDFGLVRGKALGFLSSSGQILGTPAYMSPEQAGASKLIDHRSDIYSLGASLYHLASGFPPFRTNSLHGIVRAIILRRPQPLSKLRPGIHPMFEAIIAKMLAKRPADRYQSMGAVASALASFAESASRRPASPKTHGIHDLRQGAGNSQLRRSATASSAAPAPHVWSPGVGAQMLIGSSLTCLVILLLLTLHWVTRPDGIDPRIANPNEGGEPTAPPGGFNPAQEQPDPAPRREHSPSPEAQIRAAMNKRSWSTALALLQSAGSAAEDDPVLRNLKAVCEAEIQCEELILRARQAHDGHVWEVAIRLIDEVLATLQDTRTLSTQEEEIRSLRENAVREESAGAGIHNLLSRMDGMRIDAIESQVSDLAQRFNSTWEFNQHRAELEDKLARLREEHNRRAWREALDQALKAVDSESDPRRAYAKLREIYTEHRHHHQFPAYAHLLSARIEAVLEALNGLARKTYFDARSAVETGDYNSAAALLRTLLQEYADTSFVVHERSILERKLAQCRAAIKAQEEHQRLETKKRFMIDDFETGACMWAPKPTNADLDARIQVDQQSGTRTLRLRFHLGPDASIGWAAKPIGIDTAAVGISLRVKRLDSTTPTIRVGIGTALIDRASMMTLWTKEIEASDSWTAIKIRFDSLEPSDLLALGRVRGTLARETQFTRENARAIVIGCAPGKKDERKITILIDDVEFFADE